MSESPVDNAVDESIPDQPPQTTVDVPPNAEQTSQEQVSHEQASQVDETIISPRPHWVAVSLGQLIALIAAVMNASSFQLENTYQVRTNFFQLAIMYTIMTWHLGWRAPIRSNTEFYYIPFTRLQIRRHWLLYLAMSVLDVAPNFLQLISLRYTSLTSSTLLGSLTVPSTMLFSRFILARIFGPLQYLGVLLCVAGGTLTLYLDSSATDDRRHSVLGDGLAILSSVWYGLGDTVAEFAVKKIDRFEYLGMLGLFGTILSGLATILLERSAVAAMDISVPVIIGLVIYVISVLLYYSTASWFLVRSDATLLNLSLQAVNLWAVLFSNTRPPLLFFVSLVLVIAGVFVYETPLGEWWCKGRRQQPRVSYETVELGVDVD